MAEQLDEYVTQFLHRPPDDAGPFTLVPADALTMKDREGGVVVKTVAMIATGVNADGRREALSVQTRASEMAAGCNMLFADLVTRGFNGGRPVTSDA